MADKKQLNIEKSLRQGINMAPMLDFEKLAAMPVVKMTELDYITRQPQKTVKKARFLPKYFKPVSVAFAGILVMLVCISSWFAEFNNPESVITLDANQSVEIVTNKHMQILTVKTVNENVQEKLDQENLDQTNLEASVGQIITTMIKNGYIDADKNVVMVSVENQNTAKADDLAGSLNQVIKASATAENVSATVVNQTVAPDQKAVTEAQQYNVSTGKLNVMKELVTADSSLKMETLASMSLTDLLVVSKEKAVDLTSVIKIDESEKDIKGTETTVPPIVTEPITPTETVAEPSDETVVDTSTSEPLEINNPVTPDQAIVSEETKKPAEEVLTPGDKTTEAEKPAEGDKKTEGEKTPEAEKPPEGEKTTLDEPMTVEPQPAMPAPTEPQPPVNPID